MRPSSSEANSPSRSLGSEIRRESRLEAKPPLLNNARSRCPSRLLSFLLCALFSAVPCAGTESNEPTLAIAIDQYVESHFPPINPQTISRIEDDLVAAFTGTKPRKRSKVTSVSGQKARPPSKDKGKPEAKEYGSRVSVTRSLPKNTHALVADTSQYFANYRHYVDTLAIYKTMQAMGVESSKVHLWSGGCGNCDPRSAIHARVHYETSHSYDFLNETSAPNPLHMKRDELSVNTWVNFLSGRGAVHSFGGATLPGSPEHQSKPPASLANSHGPTAAAFTSVLRHHHQPARFMPESKLLLTDEFSNLLIYINGHSGDGFTNFRDFDELSSLEFGEAVLELKIRRKFDKLLILIDSCQALTLSERLETPNTFLIASSMRGKNSYSVNDDFELGVSLMDRMSLTMTRFFTSKRMLDLKRLTWDHFLRQVDTDFLMAEPGIRADRLVQNLAQKGSRQSAAQSKSAPHADATLHPPAEANSHEFLLDWLADGHVARHVLSGSGPLSPEGSDSAKVSAFSPAPIFVL